MCFEVAACVRKDLLPLGRMARSSGRGGDGVDGCRQREKQERVGIVESNVCAESVVDITFRTETLPAWETWKWKDGTREGTCPERIPPAVYVHRGPPTCLGEGKVPFLPP